FEGKIRVISHNVTVNVLQALLHQAVGQFFKHLDWIFVTLSADVIGKLAPGKIGIATSDQYEVSSQTTIAIERSGGFDCCMKLVIRSHQRDCGGGREELGVGGGGKKLLGIQAVKQL